MNKVISINLNGNAYQVDESGYSALKDYLDAAELQLKQNPDRAEIIADLEQAIAEKCRKFLGSNKTVVSASEVSQIIAEMGPVDGDAGDSTEEQSGAKNKDSGPNTVPPKRLYLIHEDSMLSGVCEGLGAYLHVDPTIVRIVFIVLTFVTSGFFAIVYILLALVIPAAKTSEERAAAQGKRFSAQGVIDEAKKTYEEFRNNKEWKKKWARQKQQWKRMWRGTTVMWGQSVQQGVSYSARIVGGLMFPFLFLLNMAIAVVAVLAIYSLINSGVGTAWRLPFSTPGVVEMLAVLAILGGVLTSPFRAARRAAYCAADSSLAIWQVWSGLISLAFMLAAAWFAYMAIPQLHYIVNNLPEILDGILGR